MSNDPGVVVCASTRVSGARRIPLCTLPALPFILALAACNAPASIFEGEWISGAPTSPAIFCHFGSNGRLRWTIDFASGAESFDLAYRVDDSVRHVHLDIGPWPEGPLAGRTLLGIVEIESPDRFRVDFEPGDPAGDESERPVAFSAQTLTFLRRVN